MVTVDSCLGSWESVAGVAGDGLVVDGDDDKPELMPVAAWSWLADMLWLALTSDRSFSNMSAHALITNLREGDDW